VISFLFHALLPRLIDREEPSLDPAGVKKDENPNADENSIRWMKIVLFGLGCVFILVGLIRQWPIVEKTYMQFIEGDGYLSLMLGKRVLKGLTN